MALKPLVKPVVSLACQSTSLGQRLKLPLPPTGVILKHPATPPKIEFSVAFRKGALEVLTAKVADRASPDEIKLVIVSGEELVRLKKRDNKGRVWMTDVLTVAWRRKYKFCDLRTVLPVLMDPQRTEGLVMLCENPKPKHYSYNPKSHLYVEHMVCFTLGGKVSQPFVRVETRGRMEHKIPADLLLVFQTTT
jgi:hypothetical protein